MTPKSNIDNFNVTETSNIGSVNVTFEGHIDNVIVALKKLNQKITLNM